MAEGWASPANTRKRHFFRGSRSLCGGWIFFGKDLEQGKDEHSDNCKACQKKRLKEIADAKKEESS